MIPAMEAPPTPKSFSDLAPSVVAAPSSTTHPALSPISDEFQQTDSPIFSTFGHSAQRGDSSSTIAESFIDPPSPAPVAASRPTSAAGPAPPATTVDQTGPAPARYGSLRVRADKGSLSRQDSSATPSPVSASAPSQIEVANMVSQVRARRATVVELADTVGILGDKYYECLRGYTSIQEPNSAFWKRRYFAVADKTLFMYTNECSRTPSDYLAMHGIVAPPRDAEDEVLMPHSIAVNFGKGECYMYFDTASMKQAFESEVRKATAAA
ncbi:hypothetical protein H4R19_000737 [Coemansia spiralis]|nr:hypothetical protein H4R19_000737 [Coemansia spiralis]